jgi:hypothetical protein
MKNKRSIRQKAACAAYSNRQASSGRAARHTKTISATGPPSGGMSPNEENVSQFLLCVNHTYSELVQNPRITKARSIENKTQYASRGQDARQVQTQKVIPIFQKVIGQNRTQCSIVQIRTAFFEPGACFHGILTTFSIPCSQEASGSRWRKVPLEPTGSRPGTVHQSARPGLPHRKRNSSYSENRDTRSRSTCSTKAV